MNITLYTKANCPQCTATKRQLDKRGLPYTTVDITANARISDRLRNEGWRELHVDEPYVLLTPTYGGGTIGKAVPVQVKRFLNDERNRSGIIGVIASGNTNFGEAYGIAGDIIAAKCRVPLLYRFELMGTSEDTATVREGLRRFFDEYTQQEQR